MGICNRFISEVILFNFFKKQKLRHVIQPLIVLAASCLIFQHCNSSNLCLTVCFICYRKDCVYISLLNFYIQENHEKCNSEEQAYPPHPLKAKEEPCIVIL